MQPCTCVLLEALQCREAASSLLLSSLRLNDHFVIFQTMRDVTSESSEGPPTARKWRGTWGWFGVLLALFVFLGWPTISDLAGLYLADPDYSHGFLIAPVALYLIYLRRRRFDSDAASDATIGLILTALGTVVVTFGQWYDAVFLPMTALFLSISGLGLIICLLGIVRTVFGRLNGRLMLFPIAYLVFALPLPGPLMSQLTLSLQSLSSYLAAGSLQLLGTTVVREGNILQLPEGAIGVAAACSGIRSLWCLLALAVALSEIKKLQPLKASVLVAAVPILGAAGNLIRLVTTGLLVAHGRQDLASGKYHEALGLLTILLPGAAIFGLGELLARRRQPPSDSGVACGETPLGTRSVESGALARRKSRMVACVLAGCVLVLGAGVAGVVREHFLTLYRTMVRQEATSLAQRKQLSELPDTIGGFTQFAGHDLSPSEIDTLAMSEYVKRTYAKAGEPEIGLTLMFWNPRQVDVPRWPVLYPHVADGCYPGSGWIRAPRYDKDVRESWLPQGTVLVTRLFSKNGRTRVIVFWRSETHGAGSPGIVPRLQKMFTAWSKPPSTHLRSQYSVKIEVDVEGGEVESARKAAVNFARSVAPLLWEYGIGERSLERGEGTAACP